MSVVNTIFSLLGQRSNKSDFYKPKIISIGTGSYYSKIIGYFYAEIKIGNYTSIGKPLYIYGKSEHPWSLNNNLVSTYPFKEKWQVDYPACEGKGRITIGKDWPECNNFIRGSNR